MTSNTSTFIDRHADGILQDLPNSFKRVKWLQKTPVQGGNDELDKGEPSKKGKQTVLHCKYHSGRVFQRVSLLLSSTLVALYKGDD
jgi:hypothetical protein